MARTHAEEKLWGCPPATLDRVRLLPGRETSAVTNSDHKICDRSDGSAMVAIQFILRGQKIAALHAKIISVDDEYRYFSSTTTVLTFLNKKEKRRLHS